MFVRDRLEQSRVTASLIFVELVAKRYVLSTWLDAEAGNGCHSNDDAHDVVLGNGCSNITFSRRLPGDRL